MRLRPLANPESNSLPQTTPDTSTWSFPGVPISINLPLTLMTRLQVAIAEQEMSVGEVGGVLLGSVGRPPASVDIHDFICIPSAVQSDGVYKLDTGELERLRERTVDPSLDQTGTPQLPVIGYFRTQAQGTSELRELELELVKQYFPDPTNVVLLIQTQQKTAGFFCWCGDFFTPCSFKDFSFDAASLRPGAAPPPATSAPIGRSERLSTVSWATNQSYFARAVLATGVALLTLAFLYGLSAGVPGRPMQKPTLQGAVATSVPLKLELEAQGDGLNVRWNPESTLIKHAAKGNLVILQPDRLQQNITLSPDDLSKGRLYYRSSAERLEFRLELVDGSGRIEKDSVLALSPTPAATTLAEHRAPAPAQSLVTAGRVSPDLPVRMRNASDRNSRSPQRHPGQDVFSKVAPALPAATPKRNPTPPIARGESTAGFFWR